MEFRRATPADVPLLRELAETIWREYYPAIIGTEQVEYMLGRMYSEQTINREMAEGVVWEIVALAHNVVGLLSVSAESDRRAKLNKLYLLSEMHGRGHGHAMIQRACQIARGFAATELYLQVNKRNARALRAYERAGFHRVKEAVFDIGGGFFMDDYVLAQAL